MKKVWFYIIISVIAAILLGLCVWWSISIYQQNHALWLNEYNTQMQQFGFYKEDISLLDQYSAKLGVAVQTIFNVIAYIVVVVLAIAGYWYIDDNIGY